MIPICQGCQQPVTAGQLYSGVRVNAQRIHHGHYACVVTLLGPTLTLKAIQRGMLPMIDPATLHQGQLPKFHAQAVRAPVEDLVETMEGEDLG